MADEPTQAEIIQAARQAKARKIALWLQGEFLKTVEHATPEMRQNSALRAGCNAKTVPSNESWQMVVEILSLESGHNIDEGAEAIVKAAAARWAKKGTHA